MRSLLTALLPLFIAAPAIADSASVVAFHLNELPAATERSFIDSSRFTAPAVVDTAAQIRTDATRPPFVQTAPKVLAVYPIAGIAGRDFHVPFWFDLDDSAGLRDWKCTQQTYNGHKGEDQYIHSFREQEVGVPVYAALDGYVDSVHDGEPDENTSNEDDPANFVVIDHRGGQFTEYVHLKNGSIPVTPGQFVSAGTQVGLVGSSGQSTAPHLHFGAWYGGVYYEPMAGPCRAGASGFAMPPDIAYSPTVFGPVMSDRPFNVEPPQALHDPPHTGTFLLGARTIYVSTVAGDIPANTNYQITLVMPGGTRIDAGSGSFGPRELTVIHPDWAINANFTRTGSGQVEIKVGTAQPIILPFRVVSSGAGVVNHRPDTPQVSIEPVGIRAADVAVCRVQNDFVADPDYDTVTYHYVWRVNDAVVRDVSTAVRSDVLARDFVKAYSDLSCTVTVSDGSLETQPVAAHATPTWTRRRAVGH